MKKGFLILAVVLLTIMMAVSVIDQEVSARSRVYRIAQKGPAGGWVFFDKGDYSGGWRYLEAAPEGLGDVEWGCYKKDIPETKRRAIGTGRNNTEAIVKNCGERDTAAGRALAYRGGRKNDWYLPSRDELEVMNLNLRKAGIVGFDYFDYWSSTEFSADEAWAWSYSLGCLTLSKDYPIIGVRPIRAF